MGDSCSVTSGTGAAWDGKLDGMGLETRRVVAQCMVAGFRERFDVSSIVRYIYIASTLLIYLDVDVVDLSSYLSCYLSSPATLPDALPEITESFPESFQAAFQNCAGACPGYRVGYSLQSL